MKALSALLLLFFLSAACNFKQIKSKPENTKMETSTQSFYDFKLKSLDGKQDIEFSQYRGKKVLLVNVASKCGFTPQYEALQELHEKHGDKVVVIGVPCNEFGGQEPGTAEEIAQFCERNYGVSFQMLEKIAVKKGDRQHALYQWLSSKDMNGWNDDAPSWNFCKYLVNEKGELEKFYNSGISPMGEEILKAIGA